jgi:hypothetical protein
MAPRLIHNRPGSGVLRECLGQVRYVGAAPPARKRRFVGKSRVAATRVQGEGIKRAMIAPKVRSFLEHSSRRDNFRVLSVPRDLAAQPVSVLVQDLEGLHRALMPMLDPPEYSPELFVD